MKTKKLISVFSILMLLLLSACIFDSEEEKDTKGIISGVVKDATTSQPINSVNVSIPNLVSTTTNSNGQYSFDELEPKEYFLMFNKDGYLENSSTVTVNAGNTATADIQLIPIIPNMVVAPEFLNFGSQSTTKTFTITNEGTGELDWSISPTEPWVSITPMSGTVSSGSSPVTVTVDKTGMSYGNHSTSITITSNANSKTIEAFVVVPDPNGLQLSAYPTNLDFGISGTTMDFNIENSGVGMLTWNLTNDVAWLSCSSTSGTVETEVDNITVTVDRYGLSSGTYTGNININSDGNSQNITVSMEVSDQPLLLVQPNSLDFGEDSEQLTFQIENAGEGDLTWEIVDDQTWMSQSTISGTNDQSITVTVEREGMSVGLYEGNIFISSNAGEQNVAVSMEVTNNLPDGVTLLDPTNLTGSSVDLSWSRYTGGDFAAYRLYRHTSPTVNNQNGTLIVEYLNNTDQTVTDNDIQPETSYYYKVYVLNSSDQMLPSNTVTVVTPPELGQWYTVQTTGTSLNGVDMLNEYFGFAVGSSGQIMSYNGTSWTDENTSFSSTLSDVKIISLTNVIALNSSNLYKFDGVNWDVFEGADGGYSITILDVNHIWIGDYNGRINFYNGVEWTTDDLDYGDIVGIHAVDEENVFAFDEYGKVIHYNGIGWIELTDLDNGCFESIYAFSENDIWIAGNDHYTQKLFHFNGSEWQEIINENEYEINDIYGLSSDNVWFACNDGIVLHWDGNSIQQVTTSISSNINAIKMISNSDGWAVGESGKLLRYQ